MPALITILVSGMLVKSPFIGPANGRDSRQFGVVDQSDLLEIGPGPGKTILDFGLAGFFRVVGLGSDFFGKAKELDHSLGDFLVGS